MTKQENIKKGYKNTKLGLIPEEWEVVTLNDIGTFSKGKGIKKSEVTVEGLPCIRYAEIYTKYDNYTTKLSSRIDVLTTVFTNKIYKGDLLFAGSGETLEDIGKCVAYLGNEIAYAGGDIIILKNVKQNSKYLGLLLNNDIVKRQTFRLGQGHSVVHIYSSSLKNVKIPLPPLNQQQKIAKILSTWDIAINKQTQLIQAKQKQKKALMQLLLTGKKRFDGFTEEWKEMKLDEIGEIKTGNTPSKANDNFWSGLNNWVTADDMKKKYISSTCQKLTNLGYEKARKVGKGSLLVTCIASIGKNVITKKETGFNQQINSITPKNNFNVEFIYYLINFNKNILLSYAGAGAMPMLNKNTFKSIKMFFPTLKEQKKIAKVLSKADQEISLLKEQLVQLQQQKQGLMQVLLTGKVLVKV